MASSPDKIKINLFCFPFAGGNTYSFREFPKHFPDFINVLPIEIPGRGKRLSEKLLTNIDDIVSDIFINIKGCLANPYAIYGHSMGGLIGYLFAQKAPHTSKPIHLFVSGKSAPSVKSKRENEYLLPKHQFIELLKKYEGTPSEIFSNNELFDFFEPILRADFQAVDTYRYEEGKPLDIPITVITGLRDADVTYEDAIKWQKETVKKFQIYQFPGGHFFIFEHLMHLCNIISKTLGNAL
ncbi:MAG: thioesterase [Desulfobacterales bacterium]|nr:thioesterase [Desulfobacterales bacterium]MBF0396584.1 thioesterase [Desulfobacterales bacterium]